MNLTLKIKLLPSDEQAAKLIDVIERFNQACNLASQIAYDLQTSSQVRIHHECYYVIREKFNLPAQYAIRAIGKVAEAYRRDKKTLHKFKPHGAVVLDNRLLSYKGIDRVSIASAPGRMVMPFVVGDYGKQIFQRVKGQADLVYKNGMFFLLQNCVLPDGTPIDPDGFLGVDLGITNIATDSDGEVFSGKTVKAVRHRHRNLRSKLQKKGTKSAKRRYMLKRYDLMIIQDRIDAIQGQYVYLVSDVDATMIERPDAETIEVLKEIRRHYLDHATRCDGVRNQMAPRQKELNMYRVRILTALLRLMGVEVKT